LKNQNGKLWYPAAGGMIYSSRSDTLILHFDFLHFALKIDNHYNIFLGPVEPDLLAEKALEFFRKYGLPRRKYYHII